MFGVGLTVWLGCTGTTATAKFCLIQPVDTQIRWLSLKLRRLRTYSNAILRASVKRTVRALACFEKGKFGAWLKQKNKCHFGPGEPWIPNRDCISLLVALPLERDAMSSQRYCYFAGFADMLLVGCFSRDI